MKKEGKTDYQNETQQNLMKIVEYLATDVFRITTIKEIVDALDITYSKASWVLHNLKIRDWAEQQGDGWRLSPRIVRIADSVRANLGETTRRYLGD
jgi:DNA-binding IclR family transcriptional regulator